MNLIKSMISNSDWPKTTLTFLACSILFIWCIPNTIALRNALLFFGAINSIYLLISFRKQFDTPSRNYVPLALLGCLYLWAVVHYEFFSLEPQLELKELQSIWLRAFAGSLIAVAIPLCVIGNRHRSNFFSFFIFSTPIINIFLYICACITSGHLITPQEYVGGFAFKKIETVFFGSMATTIAAANLLSALAKKENSQLSRNSGVMYWIFGIAICFISALVSNTKNGILIGLFIAMTAGGYLLFGAIRNKSNRKLGITLALGLIIFSLGAWNIHDRFSSGGWNTLIADIKAGLDTETNREWNMQNSGKFLPLNELGEKVSGSTYMRVAWAKVGVGLIKEFPLGYGSINSSYDGLTNLSGIDPGKHGQTHSGWVDFGLAYGIPGLLLLAGALACILLLAPLNPHFWVMQAFFIALTFFPLALIAEIIWKQYFEATLFFATYAAALLLGRYPMGNMASSKR